MKKSDLKTGMWVQLRYGAMAMVLLGTKDGDILSGETWCPLKAYNEDLIRTDEVIEQNSCDIVRVHQPLDNASYCGRGLKDIFNVMHSDLIWERKETKEMTVAEIEKELGYSVKIIKE